MKISWQMEQRLKNLKEDMVWLVEEKRDGKRVLVPKVYLANDYERPNGATISAGSIDLEVEKSVENSGRIYANEEMRIQADEIKNLQGNIGSAGLIDLGATKDIVNLSGTIKGGEVQLTSEEGNIINETLVSHSIPYHFSSFTRYFYDIIRQNRTQNTKKGQI